MFSAKIVVTGNQKIFSFHFVKPSFLRFLEYAPEEKMAKLLRGEDIHFQAEDSLASPADHDGYIIPEYKTEYVDRSIRETLEI